MHRPGERLRWLAAVALVTFLSGSASAAEIAAGADAGDVSEAFWVWWVALAGSVVALIFAFIFYKGMMASDEGDEKMVEVAGYVREGASAYLRQQYKVVAIFFAAIFVILFVMAFVLEAQSRWVPFAFLSGGFFSGLAGFLGMKTATWASSRTTAGAKHSLNAGLRVAFRSGAVMGLTVVGLGLLDICLWFAVLYWLVPALGGQPLSLGEITVTMLCFGMGASSQALFARVGGGIYTKAADVGADLVGKVEAGIPEDDPRNPATIADNVGDNVGDVAGMGADLYESYCGSILATAALGVAAFGVHASAAQQIKALMLPMAIAGVGILLSIVGIYAVRTKEDATQRSLLRALGLGVNLSSGAILLASFLLVWALLGMEYIGVFGSIASGLIAGVVIGKWTEYSTSDAFRPTQSIAEQAKTGPATVIIAGLAEGMFSTIVPVLTVGAATILAFGFANGFDFSLDSLSISQGLYGIGIAAVGMLSTLGITLATDAYGPIADNAGGNAEMTGQEAYVRERTDALDALGNTTAATGKGFAIGSAALTALALLAAYLEEVRIGQIREATGVVQAYLGTHKEAKSLLLPLGGRKYARYEATAESDHDKYTAYMLLDKEGEAPTEPVSFTVQSTDTGANRETLKVPGGLLTVASARTAGLPQFMDFYHVHLINPSVLVGLFLGAMLAFAFCSMTMKAVGRAAGDMVEEVRRQFREMPGIMEGTQKPDYPACVRISTLAAQKEMVIPSLMALAAPVVVGLLLGISGVMGLLAGGLTTGFVLAVMMANAGGAWDNAKKYIEKGELGGKGSDAHKACVVGDTVGDPFKDTSGPSLNILIKLMSMVSVVFAGFIVKYALG